MKQWYAIYLAITVLLQASAATAGSPNPATGSAAGYTVTWDHSSPLTVVETITDLDDGSWQYDYSFANTDTSPIWHMMIFTTFNPGTPAPMIAPEGRDTWAAHNWSTLNVVSKHYDARNINTGLVGQINMNTMPFIDPLSSIQVGEVVTKFSFISFVYNNTPKYYLYETIASGYALTNGTGNVAAVGKTVPEPASAILLLLATGLTVARCRNKKS